jgi:hypothetical protein
MAEVSKTGTPSISTPWPAKESLITGLLAGEDLAGLDAVYLKASDGKIWKATGAAATRPAAVLGFAAKAASEGEACTVIVANSNVMVGYGPNISGTAVAADTLLYLSGTVAGGLADAASTGGIYPIAYALGDGRIMIGAPVSITAYDAPD